MHGRHCAVAVSGRYLCGRRRVYLVSGVPPLHVRRGLVLSAWVAVHLRRRVPNGVLLHWWRGCCRIVHVLCRIFLPCWHECCGYRYRRHVRNRLHCGLLLCREQRADWVPRRQLFDGRRGFHVPCGVPAVWRRLLWRRTRTGGRWEHGCNLYGVVPGRLLLPARLDERHCVAKCVPGRFLLRDNDRVGASWLQPGLLLRRW